MSRVDAAVQAAIEDGFRWLREPTARRMLDAADGEVRRAVDRLVSAALGVHDGADRVAWAALDDALVGLEEAFG